MCNLFLLTLSPSYRPVPSSRAPTLTARYRLPRLPLLLAATACRNQVLLKFFYCAHKTITLNTMTLPTTSAIDFCACLSASFPDFQLNCYAFDEFVAPFSQVLTLFNGCVAGMNARLRFGTRLRWFLTAEFGENGHFAAALGYGNDVDLKLIGMSDVNSDSSDTNNASVATSLTATIL